MKKLIIQSFQWLKSLGNFFSLIVAIFLLGALSFGVYGFFCDSKFSGPVLFTLSAVLAGLLVFLRNSEKERQNFYLEKAISGYQNALEILTHEYKGIRTNRRVEWIAAARVLQDSNNLSKKIVSKHHREAHLIYKNKYRLLISNVLEFDSKGAKLPASFWYGVDPNLDLDAAAEKSTEKGPDGISKLENIPEEAIFLIWSFAQFPENYEDPLDSAGEFSAKKIRFMQAALNPGLAKYLKHQDKYFSFGGKLTEKKPHRKRREE